MACGRATIGGFPSARAASVCRLPKGAPLALPVRSGDAARGLRRRGRAADRLLLQTHSSGPHRRAARVVALRQRKRTSPAEAAATVVVERIYDVLVLLILLFLAVPLAPARHLASRGCRPRVRPRRRDRGCDGRPSRLWSSPRALRASAVRAVLFVSAERLEHIGETSARDLPGSEGRGWCSQHSSGRRSPGSRSPSPPVRAARLHLGVPILAALLVVIATNLAQILPSSPSAVGVFEAATLVALHSYNIPDSRSLSCALVLHVLNLIPFLVAGIVILRGTLRTIHPTALEESALDAQRSA